MYPALLPGLRIPSYGAMLLLATAAGWWLARRRAEKVGLAAWQIDWLIPLLLLASAAGGRVAGSWSGWLAAGASNHRVLYGAVAAGVLAACVYGWALRIPLGPLADAFSLPLLIAIGLIRLGCFLAGCCWGDVCAVPETLAAVPDAAWRRQVQTLPALSPAGFPLAVTFPADSFASRQHVAAGLQTPGEARSLPVHPVQLYEVAAAGFLLGILLLLDRRVRWAGESFLLAGVGYAGCRFVIEWFRADQPLLANGWTFSQWCCLPLAIAGVATWGIRRLLAKRSPDAYARRR